MTNNMGFAPLKSGTNPDPVPTKSCDHKGQFNYRDIGSGMAIRYCDGCGLTHVLVQNGTGAFLLVEVPEYGTEKWEEVTLLEEKHEGEEVEDALADAIVQAAEGAEPDGAAVPELAEALSEMQPDVAEQSVSSRPRGKRRASRRLQSVQAPDEPDADAEAAS